MCTDFLELSFPSNTFTKIEKLKTKRHERANRDKNSSTIQKSSIHEIVRSQKITNSDSLSVVFRFFLHDDRQAFLAASTDSDLTPSADRLRPDETALLKSSLACWGSSCHLKKRNSQKIKTIIQKRFTCELFLAWSRGDPPIRAFPIALANRPRFWKRRTDFWKKYAVKNKIKNQKNLTWCA